MGTERHRRRPSITNLSHTITGVRGGRLDRRLQLWSSPGLQFERACLAHSMVTCPTADVNENS